MKRFNKNPFKRPKEKIVLILCKFGGKFDNFVVSNYTKMPIIAVPTLRQILDEIIIISHISRTSMSLDSRLIRE